MRDWESIGREFGKAAVWGKRRFDQAAASSKVGWRAFKDALDNPRQSPPKLDYPEEGSFGETLLKPTDAENTFEDTAKGEARRTPRPPYKRETIPKSVKNHVWQRDGGRCVECGSDERLEYDHIIPVSKGGNSTERNIQILCTPCNRSKGSKIG